MPNTQALNASPPNGVAGGVALADDSRWKQDGRTISVVVVQDTESSIQASVVSDRGGTLKFTGADAARFDCSLNGTDYAAFQTIPAGTTAVWLRVSPQAGDGALTARVGVWR
jgi:uncharacterized Ntn-hydrolase superfamily protein